jgi:hypothetical protein
MSRRPATFSQKDLERALKAAKAVGCASQVEVDRNGKIIVVLANQGKTKEVELDVLDQWMAKHADQVEGH